MTITMGTPSLKDHGAVMLSDTVKFLKEGFDIPIHVQLTLPGRENIKLLYNSGADTIGVHIETLDKEIFKEMCPGKSKLGFENHLDNLGYAAQIFGENQVSTFILAGLGESKEKTTDGFKKLAEIGVIPYLVPFRPLPNTPLENRSPPSIEYMLELYKKLAETLDEHGVTPLKNKAGCVRCGACSSINEAMEVV
jgi:radical SAM protein (TIGR04043 family)